MISDNVSFNSTEFRAFAREWDITLITTSPRYPQVNGMAERAVQIAKNILRKVQASNTDIFTAFLNYRNTPVKGMNISPPQMCQSRSLRTKLTVSQKYLKPKIHTNIRQDLKLKQEAQKTYYNKSAENLPVLRKGQNALIRKEKT